MADSRADELIRYQDQLQADRATFDCQLQEVAERVRPDSGLFNTSRTPGDKRNLKVFDDTAPLALSKFAAAVISFTMPPTQNYMALTTGDPDLDKDIEAARYLEDMTRIIMQARYAPRANFQTQSGEVVLDIGAFGSGVLFIEDELGYGPRYKSYPLPQTYYAEDGNGRVNIVHRKFQMAAYQLANRARTSGWQLPDAIAQAAAKSPMQKFSVLHCIRPNDDMKAGDATYRGMPFYSCYVAVDQREVMSEGGFRTFPCAVPRFETAPDETYGRGPALKVLPTIKMLNEMMKTIIRAAHLQTQPPILLASDALRAFRATPNALNYGGLDDQGNELAKPFNTGARVDIGTDMLSSLREVVNDAFFVTLFRILEENPTITATEAMLRAQEKGQLLQPTMGRIQTEMLDVTNEREIDILAQYRRFPPAPDVLKEAGARLRVQYKSPINLAQQAGAGVGIMNTLNALGSIVQLDPRAKNVMDGVKAAREVGRYFGAPADVLRTDEEIADIEDGQEQALNEQQLLAAAPVAAGTAKDLAQAQALAASAPNQAAPALLPA